MEFFDKIYKFIYSAEGAAVTIAIVVDFAFRLIKTEKPKSVIYLVADIIKKSGDVLVRIGKFLDSILPQRLK